jgi:hypothetical protein
MGDLGDDLGSIFDHLREAALTMQQGGGIGYDFISLRPKGATVKGVGADASGPLSFMDVWDDSLAWPHDALRRNAGKFFGSLEFVKALKKGGGVKVG